jgi:hypothetical protein
MTDDLALIGRLNPERLEDLATEYARNNLLKCCVDIRWF